MKDTTLFGWLPDDRGYVSSEYVIEPSDGYADALEYVQQSKQIGSDGWYYPPGR
jgi:hypothetical protein